MIIAKQNGDLIDVAAIARSPMIYLDNWAISGVFANDRARQQRLLDFLKKRGTLLLSWANILELPAYAPIRTFFEGIGANWYPLEWNFFACMRREEQQAPGNHSPAFSASLLKMYYPFVHKQGCSLTELLSLTSKNLASVRTARNKIKDTIQVVVNGVKSAYSKDPDWIDKQFPPVPFYGLQPTRYIYNRLIRTLAAERGSTFTHNDGMDLMHTVVPVAYANFVLLDKSWTQRVRSLPTPGRTVYSFYEAEIDEFLTTLENWVGSC